ncbi:toll/interleukin-1 receptor domain-containing protein [Aeromonas hydrophila]|uniref:toll/interleukin-1 receptor domain-containing protein n=1 Tax=Aeromonas hydrophila TaxID=644 RepID=UPI001F6223B9|nr:toll/interleukin-1 receptor domain-containing protein [Aeromonas hydrophila]UNU29271.1 TIR domain-containing protein [Aeromonas hydrophila]
MSEKLIFLSHIHEERELALLVKQAIEEEFSGFVTVFVSSDGTSIPAGSNFLKRIEDGLIDCIGAIYLISPSSVKRNWINFELGAVWIRNIKNLRDGREEIPAIPVCHSGMTPSNLPQPLNNLNAIPANQASQLESAFRSLQNAVGGRGSLRTDFDELARKIINFENTYTITDRINKIRTILRGKFSLSKVKSLSNGNYVINLYFLSKETFDLVKSLIPIPLKNDFTLFMDGCGLCTFEDGNSIMGGHVDIILTPKGLNALTAILNES